jgi:hypothetical protein
MWKNRKSGTLRIANRPKSVVSKAICPANVRHSVALGKTAQKRRLFVMFAARFFYSMSYFYTRHLPAFGLHAALIRSIKVFFLLFLFSDGIFLCFALYKQFLLLNVWFVCALLSILLAITLAYLLFDEILARCTFRTYRTRPTRRTSVATRQYRSLQVPPAQQSSRVSQQYFPETPLPSQSSLNRIEGNGQGEPEVRVLETLDMSATNIEHFLDTKLPSSSLSSPPDDDNTHNGRQEGIRRVNDF